MARHLASLFTFATVVAACGFPSIDFKPADEDDGNPSSSSSSGGPGGTGGIGGAPSVGGSGGAPMCTVGDPNACPPGTKCTADENTGVIDCFVAGDRPAWTKCFSDADCSIGTFCDGDTKICHPVCQSAAQCGGAGQCIPARGAQLQPLALKMCTSDCNPISASPCSDTFGKTTCYYDVANAYWDCTQTSGLGFDQPCNSKDDCDRGLVCVSAGVCREWCFPINDFCGVGFCNAPQNIEPEWQGSAIGICAPF